MVEIGEVRSTDLFVGTADRPLQILRVTLRNPAADAPGAVRSTGPAGSRDATGSADPVTVQVRGPGVATPQPVTVPAPGPGGQRVVEVPLAVDPVLAEGARRPVVVTAIARGRRASAPAVLEVAAPGWTMVMAPHFHYDPFWWNTQAGYTSAWDEQVGIAQEYRKPGQASAFDLVKAHLDLARTDPDYKFVLCELDYLAPYWESMPEDRADLRRLVAAGRVELAGGMYNEPNTNLTCMESTIRNTVLGTAFHREVLGAAPRTGWMLDVFGHEPSFPAVLADAGLTASAWARGPFHRWGPLAASGDESGMQFAAEFEWIAPDGRGLLSGYLSHHYPAGWVIEDCETPEQALETAYRLFEELKKVAATRNVLLPMGYNHVLPPRWTTLIHREWNRRYLWPRFVCGLPGEFFDRVRRDARERAVAFSPQSRDMNPAYTGKDVSYIDIKQAQQAAEVAVLDAERLGTIASLLGARYPAEALDKAWRQLCFGAHHDGITGVPSDQVYLDLLAGWREAHDLGAQARDAAIGQLAAHVDTRGEGRALMVVNTQSAARGDTAAATVRFARPGPRSVSVLDDAGNTVPAMMDGISRHDDGTLAAAVVTFHAAAVPGIGYRVFRLLAHAAAAPAAGWRDVPGCRIENEAFAVEADPGRGGALSQILDMRTGRQLLRAGAAGNEPVCHEEYPDHPEFRKGPWHLTPTGARQRGAALPATVRAQVSPAGQRLVSTVRFGDLTVTSETVLRHGADRVEFRTRVDGSIGQDRLLRVRFPFAAGGARPVYEVGNAVIGRTFGHADVDVAQHPYLLDSPARTWVGLSSAVRVAFAGPGAGMEAGPGAAPVRHAIGVAELVAHFGRPDGGRAARSDAAVRALVAALAQQGVTTTTSAPDGARHGSLDLDSNLPDVRISVGGPETNAFTARVLAAADPAYAARLADLLADRGRALVWVPAARTRAETWEPSPELRGERDLPVLVVAGRDARQTTAALADLAADLADAEVRLDQAAPGLGADAARTDPAEQLEDYSVAVLNRGLPGAVVEPDGTLHLALMRSCSGWPAGTWIDPPARTAPDGSSFALQHWSHTFEYALVAGRGDWRAAGFVRAGQAFTTPLLVHLADPHDGVLPPAARLLGVEPDTVVLTALKPRGNPLAAQRPAPGRDTGLVAAGPPPGEQDTERAAGHDGERDGIVVRCYESSGRATRARVECFAPLRGAALLNILEEPREALVPLPDPPADGGFRFDLGAAATVTAGAVAGAPFAASTDPQADPGGAPIPLVLGPAVEPVQPAFARYWLHNKGAAPLGPPGARVFVQPQVLDLREPADLRVTVSATGGAEGAVELVLPPGVAADPAGGLGFKLGAQDDYQTFTIRLRPDGTGAPGPGVGHVAARICGPGGGALEDVATLLFGGAQRAAGELAVDAWAAGSPGGAGIRLTPGGAPARLRVRIGNPGRDEVRGEAQLISPFGTWELSGPAVRGVRVAPGGRTTLDFDLAAPPGAAPAGSWALVKISAFGAVHYTPALAVTVTAP